jgi:phosphinothricin acetyltransferase
MIRLRPVTPADAPGIHAIYAPIVESDHASFEFEPPSVVEMAARISKTISRYPWLAAVDDDQDGRIVGYAYGTEHRGRIGYRWSVEVSVYVSPEAQGKGLGTALYTALFEILEAQGFVNLFAGIALPNPGSVALHEGLGFAPIGRFPSIGWKAGRWWDTGWYHRRIGALAPQPGPPVAFPELPAELVVTALARGSATLE